MKLKRILSLSLAIMLAFSLMSFNFIVSANETVATSSAYVAEPKITNVTSSGTYTQVPWGIGTARYSDQNYTFTDFANYTFGDDAIYLQPKYADWENETYKDYTAEWLKFDINRTADIYVITYTSVKYTASAKYMRFITNDNWGIVKTDGTIQESVTNSNFSSSDYLKLTDSYTGSTNGLKYAYLYKKTITLPEDGMTTQTINLLGSGYKANGNMGVYGVVIDFKDVESDCKLSNVTYNGEARSVISPMAEGVARFKNADNEDIDLFTDFKGYTFSENSYYIQPKLADYNSATDFNAEFASFKLAQTADVYILTYINVTDSANYNYLPWVYNEGYKAIASDGVSLISAKSDGADKLYFENATTASANGRKRVYLYKKTYEVPDGETLNVSLKGQGEISNPTNYRSYGIVVDFGDGNIVPEEMPEARIFSSQVNGTQTIDGKEYSAYSLAFARALPVYGLSRRTDYGLLVSKTKSTDAELVIGADDVIRIKADNVNHPANALGQYGVLIFGAGYDCGDVYYGRPYAIYGENVIYGPVSRMDQ